jgi:hypothetical protein
MLIASVLAVFGTFAPALQAAEEGIRQPVFLICPHREKYSAWSLFLTVDPQDPGKVLSLGLEKLKKQNSKDSSFEAVLAAQKDPKTDREVLQTLSAKDFGSGMLEVQKDNALKVSVTPQSDGSLRLMVSIRISADGRFVIGGKESGKKDVVLRYNKDTKAWGAYAQTLVDTEGNNAAGAQPKAISGIVFPVKDTGIYRVVGVVDGGEAIVLLDR